MSQACGLLWLLRLLGEGTLSLSRWPSKGVGTHEHRQAMNWPGEYGSIWRSKSEAKAPHAFSQEESTNQEFRKTETVLPVFSPLGLWQDLMSKTVLPRSPGLPPPHCAPFPCFQVEAFSVVGGLRKDQMEKNDEKAKSEKNFSWKLFTLC